MYRAKSLHKLDKISNRPQKNSVGRFESEDLLEVDDRLLVSVN
jgi:hypothetical protein